MLTKDRLGGALAIVAAVLGLVLVFSTHQPEGDADDDARPGTAQLQESPGDDDGPAPGQPAPAQPGPGQPAGPAQPAQPAPPAAGDDDGDDDGD